MIDLEESEINLHSYAIVWAMLSRPNMYVHRCIGGINGKEGRGRASTANVK
jgi:hypothetical protein